MIRAVFFDVDGTLYDAAHNAVPDSTFDALERLKRRGVLRVICTGRHPVELENLPLAAVDFDAYITLNGQLCCDRDGALLFGEPLVGAGKRRLVELFESRSMPLLLMERDRTYLNVSSPRVEKLMRDYSLTETPIDTYRGGELYQAVAFLTREEEHLLAPLPDCKPARWNELALDVVSARGGKAAGLARYLRLLGLDPTQAMAVGDGENDTEMLAFAGIGVAMGNAHVSAKAAADYVTGDFYANGLAAALERYGLI